MKKAVAFLGLVLTGIALGETYTLSAPGNSSGSTPSFDSSSGWSPATTSAPCKGNGYVVEGSSESAVSTIRMQQSDPRVFGGDSLTLKYGQLNLRVASVTVPNLIVDTFGRICNQLDRSCFTLAGACSIPVDSVFEIWTLKNRDIIVDSSITGAGEVRCTVGDNANVEYVNMQGPTFGPNALSGFAGSLVIASTATVGRNLQIKFQSLPGEPEESKEDAILVDGDATLCFECSGVIWPKRGITFTANSKPTIFVKDGCVIKIESAVIAQSGFTKTGSGIVIMSGDVSQVAQNEIEVLQGDVLFGNSLRATLNGYVGEVDGQKHAPSVTIQEPVDGLGCTIEWKKISDLHWSATAPTFSEAGTHAVQCHIQCEGYADFYGIAVIQLSADDAVAFVSPYGRNEAPYNTPGNAAIDLKSAIEAVKGVETSGRRYVFVDAGSYALLERMTVDGLSLVGCGPSSTVIRRCGVDLKDSELRGMSFDGISDAVTTEGECVIDSCEFRNAQMGRYVIFAGGHAVVTNTKIINNTLNGVGLVDKLGAAPFLLRTIDNTITPNLEVADCVVCGNSAVRRSLSSGVVGVDEIVDNQLASFDRCMFMHNTGRCGIARMTADPHIDYQHSSLTMRNCLCVGCKSVDTTNVTETSTFSASVLLYALNGEIVNCTFDDCWANASILYVGKDGYSGNFSAKNNIFRDCKNETGEAILGVSALDLVAQVDHSVVYPKAAVENITPETNTFDTDVTFEGPGKSKPEYALVKGSHGLGFGDASIWRDVFQPKDLAGKARVVKDKVDVGCYQLQPMAGLMIFLCCIK